MITLFDHDPEICAAWREVLGDLPGVTITQCELRDLPPQTYLATAGNSYGIMTGGIDLAVRDLYGIEVQDAIQNHILASGPVPIGGCVIVEMPEKKHKNIVYAPTMDRPRPAWMHGVCMAVLSVLMATGEESVALPGMGTGTGALGPLEAAKAMRAGIVAYREMMG